MVDLSKGTTENYFEEFIDRIFLFPEIESAKVRDIIITRENKKENVRRAFETGYHDCCSDIDLSITVCLPKDGTVTSEEYMRQIVRFGVDENTALGFCFVPENRMYRIIFKNGMRYDFGFDFEYVEDAELNLDAKNSADKKVVNNENWPMENINRFWFVQVQALGKLYRNDYLIGSHLANMNCNETLVMQMVLRDLKYGTNHHRYGYSEELEYVKELGKSPFRCENQTFNRISDHLYAAAITYDRLAKCFYPQYNNRSEIFFDIWRSYHESIRGMVL